MVFPVTVSVSPLRRDEEVGLPPLNWGFGMGSRGWANIYNLTDEQIGLLDEAEQKMEMHDLNAAEEILLAMLKDDKDCIPVLSNLGNLYGKYFSEFEKAVEYYEKVLALEPDNAWARDERRRYQRYSSYD
jgi:tetratricopeptide (TPR) repeat protein